MAREIAHVDDAKDRRQAFRTIKKIADHYVDTHMTKTEAKNVSPMLPTAKAKLLEGKKGADCRHRKRKFDCLGLRQGVPRFWC